MQGCPLYITCIVFFFSALLPMPRGLCLNVTNPFTYTELCDPIENALMFKTQMQATSRGQHLKDLALQP